MNVLLKKMNLSSVFTLTGSPEYIARGFALGSFIGMLPIPGFQVFVALFAAPFFNGNKKAACIAVFNTNVFTGVFVFAFNYWLGKTIFGFNTTFAFPEQIGFDFILILFAAGKEVLLSLLLGGLITGVLCAILAYYGIIWWYLRKKQE